MLRCIFLNILEEQFCLELDYESMRENLVHTNKILINDAYNLERSENVRETTRRPLSLSSSRYQVNSSRQIIAINITLAVSEASSALSTSSGVAGLKRILLVP